jgi:hypothetical protein
VGVDGGQKERDDFLTITRDALDLIKAHDPRRFATVRTHVWSIVNSFTPGYCHYDVDQHGIVIDMNVYDLDPRSAE